MNRHFLGTGRLLCALMMAGAAMAGDGAEARQLEAPQVGANEIELDALLTREAWRVMRQLEPLDGQRIAGPVRASMDVATGLISVYFPREFLPADPEGRFEEQLDAFRHALMEVSAPFVDGTGMQYRYGGRHLYFYFPRLEQEDEAARRGRRLASQATSALVSAGHGYYRRLVSDSWVTQREEHNGVLEDLITPSYAEELQRVLELRSEATVYRARSTATEMHGPSGQEWWKVAGRYHLESQYPENPEIWNSLGSGAADDRHYKEDIRSRPLIANHHGSAVAIHLHTNAAAPAATGVRVIHQPEREQDRELGSRVLCYMSELIHAVEGYEGFAVSPQPHADDKGENRLAQMPSVIVEAAFHTNPDDALALQDPNFRVAAMKGVEKGYRLWREGKGCDPLKVDPIATISVAAGQSRVVDLAFAGFPQYPVVIETKNVGCPPGWKCTDGAVALPDADTRPAQITLRCENAGSAPIYWDTRMVDDDGVKSPPVRHIVQCLRGAGVGASQAVYEDDEGAATARRLP